MSSGKLGDELESELERIADRFDAESQIYFTPHDALRTAMLAAIQACERECLKHCKAGETDHAYWQAANNCVAAIRRLQGDFR